MLSAHDCVEENRANLVCLVHLDTCRQKRHQRVENDQLWLLGLDHHLQALDAVSVEREVRSLEVVDPDVLEQTRRFLDALREIW